jgi:hypothetical protein
MEEKRKSRRMISQGPYHGASLVSDHASAMAMWRHHSLNVLAFKFMVLSLQQDDPYQSWRGNGCTSSDN